MDCFKNENFSIISNDELLLINAGSDGFFGFFADIYDSWNKMWYDAGKNIHSWVCSCH